MDKPKNWSEFYENQKKLWYNADVAPLVKCVVQLVFLHRPDEAGWYLSVRKIATHLGISKNTASKVITRAIQLGYIEGGSGRQRVRRKLKLSVPLRIPVKHENPQKNLYPTAGQVVHRRETNSVPIVGAVNSKSNSKENKPYEGDSYEKAKAMANSLRLAKSL